MANTVWNSADKSSNITLSNGDLTATGADTSGGGVRATTGISGSDKRYFKYTIDQEVSATTPRVGLANSSHTLTSNIGNTANSIGYTPGGDVRQNNSVVATLESFTDGDVIHVAVDFANGKVWFKKNSGNWNNSGSADPSTNTGGINIGLTGTAFPCLTSTQTGAAVTADFSGATGAPSGFTPFPTVVTVTTTGAGSFTIPAGVTEITFEAWGPGANGGSGANQQPGGGGGGYISATLSVTPGDIIYYQVGVADSTDSWFQKNANSIVNAWVALGGSVTAGGSASNGSVGTLISSFSGGAGAAAQGGGGTRAGSGGGGSAGPDGAGVGGSAGSGATVGAGGDGDNGVGGVGGTNVGAGAPGGDNVLGGGGGSGGPSTSNGLPGGAPGGGGGGKGRTGTSGGAGARGQIRYSYIVESTTPVVGRANETDTASARGLVNGHGQSNETDTASALARVLIRATGMASEADTASALSKKFFRTVGLATETDTAFQLSQGVQELPVGMATEADTAFNRIISHAPGLATETDSTFVHGITLGVNRANENDTAFQLYNLSVGVGLETDFAFALNAGLTAQASDETDSAFALAQVQLSAVGLAEELDTAYEQTFNLGVGLATETDTAFQLDSFTELGVGIAPEFDFAYALTAVNVRPAGLAAEADTAFANQLALVVGRATEINTAFARTALSHLPIGRANEFDQAFQLFGALEAGSGRKPHIRLDSILRDRIQPVHKTL